MTVDSSLVDRIVRGVLQQMRTPAQAAAKPATASAGPAPAVAPLAKPLADHRLNQRVVTASLIEEQVPRTASVLVVPNKAVITPAALDVVRSRKLTIRRDIAAPAAPAAISRTLAIVVRNTPAVERLCGQRAWRRELLGCPDDAAKLAISALSRGDAERLLIFAAQQHRAACLANRSSAVKAAAVSSFEELKSVLTQLRVNTLCIDPTGRSDFELARIVDLFEKSSSSGLA